MYKKKVLSMTVAAAMSISGLALTAVAQATTQAEQELRDYLSSIGIEDNFSWERIKGDTLSDATVYGVTYIKDKGTADEQRVLIKEMDFDDYSVSEEGVSVDVSYQGITDEDGVHFLLSEKLRPELHFQGLGYRQLDDAEVKLKYTMDKAMGGLEGEFKFEQDDVLDTAFDFKTEGLDMLIDQLVSMDIAALDPNMIMLSAMATKIHRLNLTLEDDGYNKRLLEHKAEHRSNIEEQYADCLQGVGEFNLSELEQGCVAIRDYFLDKKDKLHLSVNPAKPFSIGEYLPVFMLVGSSGPDAVEKLVKRILAELNLKVSN